MSACRGIELSTEVNLTSVASDRPPFTFAADPGSRRRMNVMAQSKAVLRRPMRGLEDGMSAIQQSEAAAPRLKSVIVPSCALSCRRSTASHVKPCFTPGDGSRREAWAEGCQQWVAGRPPPGLEDGMNVMQQSEASAPRSKIVIVPSCAPRCSGLTASLVMPSRLAMDRGARFTKLSC